VAAGGALAAGKGAAGVAAAARVGGVLAAGKEAAGVAAAARVGSTPNTPPTRPARRRGDAVHIHAHARQNPDQAVRHADQCRGGGRVGAGVDATRQPPPPRGDGGEAATLA